MQNKKSVSLIRVGKRVSVGKYANRQYRITSDILHRDSTQYLKLQHVNDSIVSLDNTT